MDTLIGKIIKNYKVIDLLGQGGMAQVYRAENLTTGEFVALKMMHPHLVKESNFLERFHREAKTIARLNHPNIIRVYDFIIPKDLPSPCIIMQLVKGPTLQQCLDEAARFGEHWSLNAITNLVEPLAEAIDYAHSQGMIHRDIKPNNIILQPVPPVKPIPFYERGYTLASYSSAPILTDFGMARLLDANTRLTMTGSIAGTPTYISPEQANGERGKAASDIYSFGVMIYEMLTGQAPFDADTPMAVMMQHMNASPPPMQTTRPEISEAVEKVVLKALAKMPHDRYPNAVTFARYLRQAIETKTVPREILAQTFDGMGQFKPGSLIDDRYEVEQLLGEGAFSQVYKVKDKQEEGQTFALKVINDQSVALEQLKQELKSLAALHHPLIARLYDAGKLQSGQYYLKLEHVTGKTLDKCIAENALSETKQIELLEDVLEALAHMESQRIIHRDLKPSNIIVTATAAKIIDFNVSKNVAEASRTQVGTPRYMPPEVPHFGWNQTSDLFSVGMIFYELFTGRLPFLDMAGLDSWDIPNPREFAPALPEALAQVLMKAIARRPEDRYLNAAEMLKAVRRAQLQSGTQARVSAHIAPTPQQAKTGPGKSLPICLDTIGLLRPLGQRGLGQPLAAHFSAEANYLITATGIQKLSLPNLQTEQHLWQGDSPLAAAIITAEGTKAVAATLDNHLLNIALPTGEQIGRAVQLNGAVAALSCSHDGGLIAACLKNGQGMLIAQPQGQIIRQWKTRKPLVAINPVDDTLAFMDADEMVQLIHPATGDELTRIDLLKDGVTALCFSADGKWLVTAGKRLRWWDAVSGQALGAVSAPQKVAALTVSPEGDLVAAIGEKEIAVWELGRKRKLASVRVPSAQNAAFVGTMALGIIQSGGIVSLYNLQTKQIAARRQLDCFSCVSLLADGKTAFTGDSTGTVKFWQRNQTNPVFQWQKNNQPIWAVAAHPFKPLLAIASSGTLWYLDLTVKKSVAQRRIDGANSRLTFSKDGRRLLLQKSGRAWLLDPPDQRSKPIQLKVDAAAFTPDGKALATVQKGKLIWIDASTGRQQAGWSLHPAREIAVNHTANLFAVCAPGGEISIWNNTGKRLFQLQDISTQLRDISFASDGILLGGVDDQGQFSFWDATISSRQAVLAAHHGKAVGVCFSKDGKTAVTAGVDGVVRWWGT